MQQGRPRANPVLAIHEGTATVRAWRWEDPAIGEADRDWVCCWILPVTHPSSPLLIAPLGSEKDFFFSSTD